MTNTTAGSSGKRWLKRLAALAAVVAAAALAYFGFLVATFSGNFM